MRAQKIKIGLYKMYMGLKGYTVLQNPENVPSTLVRASKRVRRIDEATLDTFEMHERVTRNFDKKNPLKTEEIFFRDRFAFFNRKKQSIEYKDNVEYNRFSTDGKNINKRKYQAKDEEIEKRDFSYVNQLTNVKRESLADYIFGAADTSSPDFISVDNLKTVGEVVTDNYYNRRKMPSKINILDVVG